MGGRRHDIVRHTNKRKLETPHQHIHVDHRQHKGHDANDDDQEGVHPRRHLQAQSVGGDGELLYINGAVYTSFLQQQEQKQEHITSRNQQIKQA